MVWTAVADGYVNDDGLFLRFDDAQANSSRAGEYNKLGPQHEVEINLDLTDLSTSNLVLSPSVSIPSGARIEQVTVVVTEVSSGANANLNLGLVRQDMSTEIDFDGLLAAADAWHEGAVGTTTEYVVGTTEAGALMGTTLSNTGLFTAYYDTAAFSSGSLAIRVLWAEPVSAPNL